MKRGFALLETIVVITFVTVSLLLLYGTFTNLVDNKRKTVLYDDMANIYKIYYLKEYLELNGLKTMETSDILKLSCDNFNLDSCSLIYDEFSIANLYLVKGNLQDYEENNYFSNFNKYLDSLSYNDKYKYWLIGEFWVEGQYYYASIGVN